MTNPWLTIPLIDYETHMESEAVQQAAMLRDALRTAVRRYQAASITILGAAGGNGLRDLSEGCVTRVTAVDFNASYLSVCRDRFSRCHWSLDIVVWDLSSARPPIASADFVFAALVLEYIDIDAFMRYAHSLISKSGHLLMLFQNPDGSVSPVTSSGIESLKSLESVHQYPDITQLVTKLTKSGLELDEMMTLSSVPGKTFFAVIMRRP